MSDSVPKKRVKNGGMVRKNPARAEDPKPPKKTAGARPATLKRARKVYDFKKNTLPKVDELIDAVNKEKENLRAVQAEREKTQKELERQQQLVKTGLTVKDRHNLVVGLLKEMDINTIQKLIELADSDELPAKEKAGIWKFLTPYQNPLPKSVDTQRGEDMNVSVNMTSYESASVNDPYFGNSKSMDPKLDKEYDEFTSDEDK